MAGRGPSGGADFLPSIPRSLFQVLGRLFYERAHDRGSYGQALLILFILWPEIRAGFQKPPAVKQAEQRVLRGLADYFLAEPI